MSEQSFILIVDDEEYVLNSIRRLFIEDPITVYAAANPRQALSMIESVDIDLVISDEKMPGMSGVDFLKCVREDHPDIIRIMLTGNPELETAIKAVNEGEIYKFLTKPWNPKELRTLILDAIKEAHLRKESKDLPKEAKQRQRETNILEKQYPGITDVERDTQGAVIISEIEEE